LGYRLLTVARINLDRPPRKRKTMARFRGGDARAARVAPMLTVAGDSDYVILCRSRDVAHYQECRRQILADRAGNTLLLPARSSSSDTKWTTEIPIDDGDAARPAY